MYKSLNSNKGNKSLIKETMKKASHKLSHKSIDSEVKVEISWEPNLKVPLPSDNCRVCLKSGIIAIFPPECTESIAESLSEICAIEINESDNLPKHLCLSCYNLLQNALLLRSTAQKTDVFLREPKQELDIDNEHLDSDSDIKYEVENDVHDNLYKSNNDYNQGDQFDHKSKQTHCNRCNLNFDTREAYFMHMKSKEHRNFKVECSICKGFYTTVYIKKHMLRHRLDPEQAFVCDICGKSFAILGAFNRHKAIHNFDLPYKCELCPYKGRFSECLKMHMRTHTGEKPYSCPHCPAKFVNKSNLNKHSSTHKTEHDFKCDGCGRGYFRKRDLELHIKVYHSGLKEHFCNICNKAFGYRKQMMKHQLRVHKREKLKSGRLPLYLQAEERKKIELEQLNPQ